jgi:hypothetical protein
VLKTYACGACDGLIAYVECPGTPQGFAWATWGGWFHIESKYEHFAPVGFTEIEFKKINSNV